MQVAAKTDTMLLGRFKVDNPQLLYLTICILALLLGCQSLDGVFCLDWLKSSFLSLLHAPDLRFALQDQKTLFSAQGWTGWAICVRDDSLRLLSSRACQNAGQL